ncbi:MAG: glycine dehydrogenase (aminomethyl-transferring), partial [Burkholderiales bacterium]
MSPAELADGSEFHARHIGPNDADLAAMLKVVGAASLDDLIGKIVPKQILKHGLLELNGPRTEQDVLADLKRIAAKNKVYKSFIGQGYYGNYTPGVILRNILENPA